MFQVIVLPISSRNAKIANDEINTRKAIMLVVNLITGITAKERNISKKSMKPSNSTTEIMYFHTTDGKRTLI
ncbi:uncharacterized protein FA14DRAFT_159224 [Meira miltonrushii]|uniref:Uncharacterized protein n=1 Tax=Meira miltonrushii TaxID=1280837 RepID=A0A316VH85_9BASI|nr:uncharacterized protein FA14DRAFT_159224 [Meira miltonrushii]PWN36952.1 hypothetical protein FA14DRAFT_159224 [Meira miltonrushii]